MAEDHVWKAFDQDLRGIERMLLEMGGLTERQVANCVDGLARNDAGLAQSVLADDDQVDTLHAEIEQKAISTIALRQPVANDLRALVGALRIANDLERIGDLAKNIAKRVILVNGELPSAKLIRGLEHQAELVLSQIKAVLDAYARRDTVKAMAVWGSDGEIDAIYGSLFRELLTYMMEDPREISACIHLLFCAKNIERMGDHATNIAETVQYIIDGHVIRDDRPKQDSLNAASQSLRHH